MMTPTVASRHLPQRGGLGGSGGEEEINTTWTPTHESFDQTFPKVCGSRAEPLLPVATGEIPWRFYLRSKYVLLCARGAKKNGEGFLT